ncbi:MAG: response regulator [Gammaproteobacteria bacterium]|nr:response regulator [Gammaproteobacteria bacterium]
MATTILICDDSNLARKQMAKSLPNNWDVDISFAKNGVEALDFIRQGKAEIMFLDLNMPELDGYGVLEAIRKNDLPTMAIVVSGDIQPEAYQRVINLGALEFIKKPVSNHQITQILDKYGIYNAPQNEPHAPSKNIDIEVSLYDAYQEVANIAMGQAADLLARLLDVFVLLAVPKVSMIEVNELKMALSQAEFNDSQSAICQGFIGSGISGEALMIFNDTSLKDIAELMKHKGDIDHSIEIELLMDISTILIGAFLKGFTQQLDITFSQSHPVIIGRHIKIADLLKQDSMHWSKTLAIEIPYNIEDKKIQCDLLILFTEDSLKPMNDRMSYILD